MVVGRAHVVMEPAPAVFVKVTGPGSAPRGALKSGAKRIESLALVLCPVGKTGNLRRSITVKQTRGADGRFGSGFEVSAGGPLAPYVLPVHQGARPHAIFPKKKGGRLVFDWPKAGLHPAVFKSVWHPGNRAQPFLRDALYLAAIE